MVVQINNIDLTSTLKLTLTLLPNTNAIPNPKADTNPNSKCSHKKREKQLRNIVVTLLRYVILLKSRYSILDRRRIWHQ